MSRDARLLFGPLGAVILAAGVAGLAATVPGYDSVRQTVSEIGEVGSPAQAAFSLMLASVAVCIVVFALGLRRASIRAGCSALGPYVTALMSICVAGIAMFPFPHPLHNVFGLAELIPYQAPWVFALTWRRSPGPRAAVSFSRAMAAVVWLAILLNLSTLDRHGVIWTSIRPVYGLIQRGLFAAWFAWCAGLGFILWRRPAG
ncbi:MAG TPA: DUF998 domain-containing protein [Phenylobacterium sp.]|jgi:hypothetical membrane protein